MRIVVLAHMEIGVHQGLGIASLAALDPTMLSPRSVSRTGRERPANLDPMTSQVLHGSANASPMARA